MGFEEHIEVCQAEKGWKGIPGRRNSCAKAQRPSAWSTVVQSMEVQPDCLGLTPALPLFLLYDLEQVFFFNALASVFSIK